MVRFNVAQCGILTAQKRTDKVVRKINATPMRCLGFKTSAEVFAKCCGVVRAG
jgi:IS30 family transposase